MGTDPISLKWGQTPFQRRAVFVDKDGTLVENVPYNVDPDRIALTKNAAEGIRALAMQGYRVMVVSNQSGAALGLFPEKALEQVEERLQDLLPVLHGFYYCPHLPETGCDCRKPAPGMLERAARELGLDLAASTMIGDKPIDLEAGRAVGASGVLVRTGYGEGDWEFRRDSFRVPPDHVAEDLLDAVEWVLAHRLVVRGGGEPAAAG